MLVSESMAFSNRWFRLFALFLMLTVITGVVHGQGTEQGVPHCSNPSIRREWRMLSRNERAEWLSAVKCLATLPHSTSFKATLDRRLSKIPPMTTKSNFFDDLSYLHMDLNLKIHFTGFFLPWHRAFIWWVERVMKDKCGYKGTQPYWDWTLDAADMSTSHILDDDPSSGFGGWGDPNDDDQITTGSVRNLTIAYPVPHRIRRSLTLQPFGDSDSEFINATFTPANVGQMVNGFVEDFVGFQGFMESGPHAGPHLIMGGDMRGQCPGNAGNDCIQGPKWSPNDPLFYVHHTMVDKLWYDWQRKSPKNFMAFRGGSINTGNDSSLNAIYPNGAPPFLDINDRMPDDGLLWNSDLRINDVMDPLSPRLCYTYQ